MTSSRTPDWVTNEETKLVYGRAMRLGAPPLILEDYHVCRGYVKGPANTGHPMTSTALLSVPMGSAIYEGVNNETPLESLKSCFQRNFFTRTNYTGEYIQVFINGTLVDESLDSVQAKTFKKATVRSLWGLGEPIHNLLNKQLFPTPEGAEDLEDDELLEKLALSRSLTSQEMVNQFGIEFDHNWLKTSEKDAQSKLDRRNENNPYVHFTSESKKGLAAAKLHSDPTVFHFSARCDLMTSAVRSMALEIKPGDELLELIEQALERVCQQSTLRYHTSGSISLAVTDKHFFAIAYKRHWSRSMTTAAVLKESVHIDRLDPSRVGVLWALLTKEVVDHPDVMYCAPEDYAMLQQFGHWLMPERAGFMRHVAIGASQSHTFRSCPPQWIPNTGVVIAQDSSLCAVKVVKGKEAFLREVVCLQMVAQSLLQLSDPAPARSFYALGYWTWGEEEPVFFNSEWGAFFDSVRGELRDLVDVKCKTRQAFATGSWWNNVPKPADLKGMEGGIIIMRVGDFNPLGGKEYQMEGQEAALKRDASEWLQYFNGAGVLHRDLRPSNVMYFPNREVSYCKYLLGHSVGKLVDNEEKDDEGVVVLGKSGKPVTDANKCVSAPPVTAGFQIIDASLSGFPGTEDPSLCGAIATSCEPADSASVSNEQCPPGQLEGAGASADHASKRRRQLTVCSTISGTTEAEVKKIQAALTEPREISKLGGQFAGAGSGVQKCPAAVGAAPEGSFWYH